MYHKKSFIIPACSIKPRRASLHEADPAKLYNKETKEKSKIKPSMTHIQYYNVKQHVRRCFRNGLIRVHSKL
jgi:hypothetical protein